MITRPMKRILQPACQLAAGLALFIAGASAQPKPPPKSPPHEHRLIEIPGEPILTRVNVELERPCRVTAGPRNDLFIVDASANKVFRVAGDKKGTAFITGLSDPSGICFDHSGNCYVSNYARGETNAGSVVRISAGGTTTVIANRLTGPKGIAFGRDGRLYVAVFGEDRIVTVDAKGRLREFRGSVATPAAVCFDARGFLYAANPVDGTVTRFSPGGKATAAWRALKTPTDLALSPEGDVLVTSYGGRAIYRLLPAGKFETYLNVPAGTIGACIDGGGNAVVVNGDQKLAVRIRDRLSVPCPHCRKMIPLRIKPRTTPKKTGSKTPI
jgi:sugar lactone lactonase YvrE